MEVMFCNSALFTDRQLEDPVELALAGNWTVDKMLELVEAFNNDLDENDPNHIYGLTIDDTPARTRCTTAQASSPPGTTARALRNWRIPPRATNS